MIQNMKGYLSKLGLNIFNYLPLSFVFNIDDLTYEKEIKEFILYFLVL